MSCSTLAQCAQELHDSIIALRVQDSQRNRAIAARVRIAIVDALVAFHVEALDSASLVIDAERQA